MNIARSREPLSRSRDTCNKTRRTHVRHRGYAFAYVRRYPVREEKRGERDREREEGEEEEEKRNEIGLLERTLFSFDRSRHFRMSVSRGCLIRRY